MTKTQTIERLVTSQLLELASHTCRTAASGCPGPFNAHKLSTVHVPNNLLSDEHIRAIYIRERASPLHYQRHVHWP